MSNDSQSSCGSSQQAVSPVPASIPDATSKGAHSDHYEGTFWGIVNRKGQIWTPQIFGTKAEAEQYREEAAKRLGVNFKRIPFTHKVVPVEFRIEPAQAIEARKGGDAKQAPSQDESAVGNADASNPGREDSHAG